MLKIGLTGGIGVGKTTVAKIFESYGIPVFYSDLESKALLLDTQMKTVVTSIFGSKSYTSQGLNRSYIAQQLFNDHSKRSALEQVVYPKVRSRFELWAQAQNTPYVINESALIFEKELQTYFDKIILVKAPVDLRIQRVIDRDQCTEKEVKARMALQSDSIQTEKLSDFVINNDEFSNLNQMCLDIHLYLTKNINNS